jgi:hypothetical protein
VEKSPYRNFYAVFEAKMAENAHEYYGEENKC